MRASQLSLGLVFYYCSCNCFFVIELQGQCLESPFLNIFSIFLCAKPWKFDTRRTHRSLSPPPSFRVQRFNQIIIIPFIKVNMQSALECKACVWSILPLVLKLQLTEISEGFSNLIIRCSHQLRAVPANYQGELKLKIPCMPSHVVFVFRTERQNLQDEFYECKKYRSQA